ncbi:MAG: protease modulator HflC [Burkholderiales bacterium]|nr:protease modulator HflC [Burkholderiales bacterium]
MNRIVSSIFALLVAGMLAASMLFVVDQRQYAIVFALGEVKEVIGNPGLHFKLPPPFQNVLYFDKRILTIDTPDSDRFITSEKKNLVVDSFVKWRISDPKLYYVSVQGRESDAVYRIQQSLKDALNNEIGRRTVNEMISGVRDRVMQDISSKVNADAAKIGVEIVDVRLKRVEFSDEIRDSVFRRMESERKRVANELRSTGFADSEKIRADADRQREVILAEANKNAQAVKGDGDAKASAIYAAAFGQNPEFYSFYRSLEAYRNSFRNKGDVLVVEPSSEFFRYLKNAGSSGAKSR